jgi:hypothetical protein
MWGLLMRHLADRSARWLYSICGALEQQPTDRVDVICNALIGLHICDVLLGTNGDHFDAAAKSADKMIVSEDAGFGLADSVPAGLYIVTAALLRRSGKRLPILVDVLSRSARIAAKAGLWASEDPVDSYEARLLLSHLGYVEGPPDFDVETLSDHAEGLDIPASTEGLEDLLRRIEAITALGTRRISVPAKATWIIELLGGLSMAAYKSYDFVTGGRALRAVHYLGNVEYLAQECMTYIRLHQRDDGRFGYFGPEEESLIAAIATFDPWRDLYLPVCISCLRTVAEVSTRWRLANCWIS